MVRYAIANAPYVSFQESNITPIYTPGNQLLILTVFQAYGKID